jgi:site-specific DNA-methyltransferase (adenine-specific)
MIQLINSECIEAMKSIPDASVDAIITDPPYGTTQCKWDSVIDFELMWEQLNRIIKPNGAIVLFGSEPFSSALRMSNINNYKYDWVWEKTQATGHLNAKRQPLRSNELISVFYKKQCTYNPQKTQGHKPMNSGIRKLSVQNRSEVYGKATKELPFGGNTDRYPRTNIVFKSDKQKSYFHSTQKPVALMEYLIKTYTNENETVLDFTMGSGSTGVACVNTKRNFIGIELDEGYFNIAKSRIDESEYKLS